MLSKKNEFNTTDLKRRLLDLLIYASPVIVTTVDAVIEKVSMGEMTLNVFYGLCISALVAVWRRYKTDYLGHALKSLKKDEKNK